MRVFKALVFVLFALRAEAAMVRVVSVEDGRTITVERNGSRERIRLAGVEITDETQARQLLRWTAGDWVMLEAAGNGEFLVYRSPDALFLNRELVLRGFARATLDGITPELRPPSRYLGTYDPPRTQTPQPRVSAPSRRRTSSDTSRRSPAARAPRARAAAKK
jgi:hypothetical protein